MDTSKSRMRLTTDASGYVEITYRDDCGYMVTRTFTAPGQIGYVTEHMRHGRTGQVCGELASTGDTLRASRETLPRVIRREYRAMRRAEQRASLDW